MRLSLLDTIRGWILEDFCRFKKKMVAVRGGVSATCPKLLLGQSCLTDSHKVLAWQGRVKDKIGLINRFNSLCLGTLESAYFGSGQAEIDILWAGTSTEVAISGEAPRT